MRGAYNGVWLVIGIVVLYYAFKYLYQFPGTNGATWADLQNMGFTPPQAFAIWSN